MANADDIRRAAYDIEHEADRLKQSTDHATRQIGLSIADRCRDLLRIADRVGSDEWNFRGAG